jgi:hypothetical protein
VISSTVNVPANIRTSKQQCDELHIIKSGFLDHETTAITITLPSSGSLGIELINDTLYNLPYISKCLVDSFWYKNVPAKFRRNVFILGFNNDQPITSQFLHKSIRGKHQSIDRKVTFNLVQRGIADTSTSLHISRAIFDNFPTYIANKPIISSASHIPDSHSQFVISPVKPARPKKSIFDLLKGPYRLNLKAAAWIQLHFHFLLPNYLLMHKFFERYLYLNIKLLK